MRLFGLIALLLVLTPAQAEPRRIALAVAHDSGGAGTERLRYAQADVIKFLGVLAELGGLSAEETQVLWGPSAAGLRVALRQTEVAVAKAVASGDEVLFIFYYSGHASAGELRLGDSRFPLVELRRALASSQAQVKLAFLDACESGAITRLKGGARAPAFVVESEGRASKGMILITSSAEREASQESEELRGSYFTHYLVSGLRGAADRSGDGRVTLDEAYGYAYHQTVAHTATTWAGPQHPTFTYDLKGHEGVVLTRLQGVSELVFAPQSAGTYLVYDQGRDMVAGELTKTEGEARRLWLPGGDYVLKKRADDHLLLQRLRLPERGRVTVSEAAFERVAFEDDVTKGGVPQTLTLSGRFGYQRFFDAPSRERLFHPGLLMGGKVELSEWLGPRLSLSADASIGGGREHLTSGPYAQAHAVDFLLLVGGVGLTIDRPLWGALIQGGPRLSAVYARRDFPDDTLPFQDLFTLCPGLSLSATVAIADWRLGAELRAHYLHYAEAGDDRSLGFGEAFFSLGYAP